MAVSVIETIKSRANASNTAYIVVVKLLCDDYSDLPTQSGLSGYELAQGCIAHVINENKDYMIDSSGNWHVYGGDSWTNVYTKSETNALLDDKQDELTTAQLDAVNSGITAAKLTADEAALVELVDDGAKNLLNCSLTEIKSDSYNSGGAYQFTWNGNVCTTPRGVTFTINSDNSIDVVATSVTADVWFRIKQNFQYDVGSYVMSGCPSGGSTTTYFIESDNLNARDTGNSIVINRSSTYTDNIFLVVKSGMTFTGTFKPMVCSKAAWDVSHAYQPYCPSMPEMYQMILALQ